MDSCVSLLGGEGGREGGGVVATAGATYEPCFYSCGTEEGSVEVPDYAVAGYEIGEGTGEEEEAG